MSVTGVIHNFIVPPLSSVYNNLKQTTALTLSAGIVTYVGNRFVAVDPKIAMAFTAATTLIYLATKPVFTHLENMARNTKANWTSRAIVSLALSVFTKNHLKLDNYAFTKIAVLAGVLIRGCEYLEQFTDTLDSTRDTDTLDSTRDIESNWNNPRYR